MSKTLKEALRQIVVLYDLEWRSKKQYCSCSMKILTCYGMTLSLKTCHYFFSHHTSHTLELYYLRWLHGFGTSCDLSNTSKRRNCFNLLRAHLVCLFKVSNFCRYFPESSVCLTYAFGIWNKKFTVKLMPLLFY